jgi:Tfp pilus assembly protein PilF
MYIQGIKVLKTDYERFKASLNKTQENLCKKQMASAHASIAESYMTEPLCDEPDAE